MTNFAIVFRIFAQFSVNHDYRSFFSKEAIRSVRSLIQYAAKFRNGILFQKLFGPITMRKKNGIETVFLVVQSLL